GRNLEPWRGVLAVALFLEELHGLTGLFEDMHRLATAYQSERSEFEASDRTRLLIRAVHLMIDERDGEADSGSLIFTTKALTDRINILAAEDDEISFEDRASFAVAKQVGWDLKRLRFHRAERASSGKRWRASLSFIEGLARSHGIPLGNVENGKNGTNG